MEKSLKNNNMQKQSSTPIVEIKHLNKVFHTTAGDFIAIENLDLTVPAGQFLSVVGKSGSGKSTLVNMITGIDHPTKGEIIVNQTDILKLNESQMADWRGKNLGIVFQFYQLLPILTILENVMLPMQLANLYTTVTQQERAMFFLEQVGIADFAHKKPSMVSGGQQQCAAIARALVNDPPLLLADEPTGNLDTASADNIFKIFDFLVNEGKTIIMVTHDDELAARAQRTIRLADGNMISDQFNFKKDNKK
jgi:putative ABC transport system ATP-binding protein